jgi:hypothetical protein
MNDLRELLAREADRVQPKGDLDDVYRRADRQQRHTKTRNVVLSAAALLVFAGGVLTVSTSNGSKIRTSSQSEVTAASLGGMVISDAKTPASYKASTLDRRDPDTADGPYSLVVRAKNGSMIQRTAVVTYQPNVVATVPARPGTIGASGATELSIARDGGTLRVRAVGLTPAEITGIGDATQVVDDRPEVALSSLPEFSVIASGSWTPSTVREARYGCADLGEIDTQGLCYTGVTFSPGFEDALFEAGFQPGPLVAGRPSAVSTIGGGSGTLAWEPRPGVIAYIGYSANPLVSAQSTVDAMARLAERVRILSPDEWIATKPMNVTQTNRWIDR